LSRFSFGFKIGSCLITKFRTWLILVTVTLIRLILTRVV
jgi:hypothetical protein